MKEFRRDPAVCHKLLLLLVQTGAKVNQRDSNNETPFLAALRSFSDAAVESIIEMNKTKLFFYQGEVFDLNARIGRYKMTGLHVIAANEDLSLLSILMRSDADFFARNTFG